MPRLPLRLPAILLALCFLPTVQAWAVMSYNTLGANVHVDANPDSPSSSQAHASVCWQHDSYWGVDYDDSGTGLTVWVPQGPNDADGSRRAGYDAGCSMDGWPAPAPDDPVPK